VCCAGRSRCSDALRRGSSGAGGDRRLERRSPRQGAGRLTTVALSRARCRSGGTRCRTSVDASRWSVSVTVPSGLR
jgi:hypothetical protein